MPALTSCCPGGLSGSCNFWWVWEEIVLQVLHRAGLVQQLVAPKQKAIGRNMCHPFSLMQSISQQVAQPPGAASHDLPPLLRGFAPTKGTACRYLWVPHPKGVLCWLDSFIHACQYALFLQVIVVLPTPMQALVPSSSECSAPSVVTSSPSLSTLNRDLHVSKYVVSRGPCKSLCIMAKLF